MTDRAWKVPMPGRHYDVDAPAAAYALVAAAAVAYAVWGSLFPFIFQAVDPAAARAAFWAAAAGGPLAWSISDFASNVLLFVPIGLFAAAAFDARKPTNERVAVWVAVFCFGVLLSVSVEISQAYVPWRTPSIVDVVAEAIGTAIGIVLRVVAAGPFDRRMAAVAAMVRRASPFERALLIYTVAFAIAWLLPLDVTLRPREIADKHFHKRLLLPFTPSPDAFSSRELAVACMAAVPLGLAAIVLGPRRGQRRSVARALAIAIPAVCALEVMQVFVFSRTTDATIMLPVTAGLLIGALLAAR